ncbi:hypothetical protein [Ovoidimarina sediminis]|nr:hypothetical protein [Rhodophyticola sp. MJ-SS7]MDU8943552.1 hypothetical protein [Rhodophyticola sp. MJ-SS7]
MRDDCVYCIRSHLSDLERLGLITVQSEGESFLLARITPRGASV